MPTAEQALLGLLGLFYGTTGVGQLKVWIDIVLLLGAVITLITGFADRHWTQAKSGG